MNLSERLIALRNRLKPGFLIKLKCDEEWYCVVEPRWNSFPHWVRFQGDTPEEAVTAMHEFLDGTREDHANNKRAPALYLADKCEVCERTENEVGPMSSNERHETICDNCAEEQRGDRVGFEQDEYEGDADYITLKDCIASGQHLTACDNDGFCEHCGHQEGACPYCNGNCPNDEDNACDGYQGDIDGLVEQQS